MASDKTSNDEPAAHAVAAEHKPQLACAKIYPVFTPPDVAKQLRQAEIISRVAQYIYDPTTDEVDQRYHEFVILISQDCDLERDFEWRAAGDLTKAEPFNELLLFEATSAEKVKVANGFNSSQWREVWQNNVERYAYIEACEAKDDLKGEGLPSLVVDFRRYFSIRPEELYRQIQFKHGARRRTRLESPYCEHMQDRLSYYLQRIALPASHRKPA